MIALARPFALAADLPHADIRLARVMVAMFASALRRGAESDALVVSALLLERPPRLLVVARARYETTIAQAADAAQLVLPRIAPAHDLRADPVPRP